MSTTMAMLRTQLSDAGYSIGELNALDGTAITFEDDTVLGFVLLYPDAANLIDNWQTDSARVLDNVQVALRQAGVKAWNAYLVLLADAGGDYGQNITLGNIEEDLVGTRKIARAGVKVPSKLRDALMPLLSLQNAPRLGAVDMPTEIKLRTSALPPEFVEGFLSNASESVLFQILESDQ